MTHIMLLFLSEVHLANNGNFTFTEYVLADGNGVVCVQTNESAVWAVHKMLARKTAGLDRVFLFATKRMQEKMTIKSETGDMMKSHIECFSERVRLMDAALADKMTVIDYDEDQPVEESIRRVTAMAQEIKAYAQNADDEVFLHADMTGGFRHASMMMLAAMQLLKYSGIRIGKVMYSNFRQKRIEDVTEIHRMFDLVAGTEEFVSFGSTNALEEYFSRQSDGAKSAELKALLETMREFSEAVQICRTAIMEKVRRDLAEKIAVFQRYAAKSLQEELFSQIIDTLQKEYGKLINEQASRLDIIEWCLEKGFLQQAMTLSTEWLPEYIVDEKLLLPADDHQEKIETWCRQHNSGYKSWQQVLLTNYGTYPNKSNDAPPKKFLAPFRAMLMAAANPETPVVFTAPFNTPLIKEMFAAIGVAKCPAKIMRKLYDREKGKQNPWKGTFAQYLPKKNQPEYIFHILGTIEEEYLRQIFTLPQEKSVMVSPAEKETEQDAPQIIDKKWKWRETQLRRMINNQQLKCGSPLAQTLLIVQDYHDIRSWRNQINHAYAGNKAPSSGAIKEKIRDCLRRIREISGK